jgi:hypothetical protein
MNRTASPVIAGVMNIVIGSINLLGVIGVGIAIAVLYSTAGATPIATTVLWIVFIVLLIFSLPSLIGGIYALQRRNWVMALVGSIASLLTWNLIGLIPLILVIISRNEFDGTPADAGPATLASAREKYARGEMTREEFERIKKQTD